MMERKQSRVKEATSFRLSPEGRRLLALLAERGGVSQAAVLETLIRERALRDGLTAGAANGSQPAGGLSLSERLAALAEQIPEEDRAGLPEDGADQHDHYIYGTPKR
jgi:hypothetical protein